EIVVDHVDWETGDCHPQEELITEEGEPYYVDSFSVTIQDFPGCGYMPKLLYDTLFDGEARYRRGEKYGEGIDTEGWYEEWQGQQEEMIIEALEEYGYRVNLERFFEYYWNGIHKNIFKSYSFDYEPDEGEVVGRLHITKNGVFVNE
ncbi:MAG: hypothetical protein F6K31_22270, partial [Symploca sp. SIO2G7]|nr:hypothetical protein [Symploca sp. SIO2G7]